MQLKEQILEELEQQKGQTISGAYLAEKLSVSRTAIWKAIHALKEEGYRIESGTNRGYRLCSENDILSVQSIGKNLPKELQQKLCIEVYKTVDSTNNIIKQYAAEGRPEGTIVIAESQTAGRGRMGRSFYSPKGSGLYMSFLFRPQISIGESLFLTTAAAVAAAESIEEAFQVPAGIKWVNDVFCHEKKVCGILTEASVNVENSALEYAVTGIGFNVTEPEGGFPEEVKDVAGAICTGSSANMVKMPDRSRLAAIMIQRFFGYYTHLAERTYMDAYRERSFLIGKPVYTLGEPRITGIAVDVDAEGHLLLQEADGTIYRLSSGEVSVRPLS